MSELNGVDTPIIINETIAEDEVRQLDWKESLTTVLGKGPDQIQFDRNWSLLCREMRQLCPETQWFSINSPSGISYKADAEIITAIRHWLKLIVAKHEWPFPERVFLINASGENVKFIISFDKPNSKLPFVTPPEGLTIVPWRDKHSVGWKISTEQTFNIDKAGEA